MAILAWIVDGSLDFSPQEVEFIKQIIFLSSLALTLVSIFCLFFAVKKVANLTQSNVYNTLGGMVQAFLLFIILGVFGAIFSSLKMIFFIAMAGAVIYFIWCFIMTFWKLYKLSDNVLFVIYCFTAIVCIAGDRLLERYAPDDLLQAILLALPSFIGIAAWASLKHLNLKDAG